MGAGAAQRKSGDPTLEADESWRPVGTKRERWWVWVALDAEFRQVVAMARGGRDEYTARGLWDALPDDYRDGAVVRTDFPEAYRAVVPEGRPAAAGKDAGLTNHGERFRCTVRRRCGRFVRKAPSFSKCDRNHVGSLGYFTRRYNACRL